MLLVNVSESSAAAQAWLHSLEGGGKGVAAFDGEIAVCSPEVGVRIYDYSLGRAPPPAAP